MLAELLASSGPLSMPSCQLEGVIGAGNVADKDSNSCWLLFQAKVHARLVVVAERATARDGGRVTTAGGVRCEGGRCEAVCERWLLKHKRKGGYEGVK
ncbi:hypothetical protein Droror1_Dr00012112 [Drosera rotundifolia]